MSKENTKKTRAQKIEDAARELMFVLHDDITDNGKGYRRCIKALAKALGD